MAVTVWKIPTDYFNPNDGAGYTWVDYQNLLVDDATSMSGGSAALDDYAWGAFDFTGLTDATITGIELELRGYDAFGDGGWAINTSITKTRDGSGAAQVWSSLKRNPASGDFGGSSGAKQTRTVGGASDLWGLTWTPADLANGKFAVRLAYTGDQYADEVRIEVLRARVHYTPAGGGDTTPPVFSVAPAAASITQTSFDLTATLNENGTVYAVVVPDGASAPSAAQVKAGQNASGAAPLASGSTSATAATQCSISLSGLAQNTPYDVYVVAEDTEPNLQAASTKVDVTTAADTTPPTFSVAPAVANLSTTTLSITSTINEAGTVYAVAVADGASAPSAAQVKAGQNASGAAAIASANVSASAGVQATLNLSGLTANTAYDVYVVAQDSAPNLQASPTKVDVTTEAADTSPPTFSVAPAVANLAATSLSITSTINETGTVYAVAVADGASAPSAAQVKAGQNASGAAAIAAGNTAATGGVQATLNLTGLTGLTAYDIYVVAQDSVPNLQASPTKVDVTTLDGTAPTFSVAPAVVNLAATAFGMRATLNEAGKFYVVVVPDAANAPSAAQVKAGQNAAGGAPVASGNVTVSSGVAGTVNLTGVVASTAYDAYVVAEDTVPNVQASPVKVDVLTPGPATITSSVLHNNTGTIQASLSGLKYWIWTNRNNAPIKTGTNGATNGQGHFVLADDAFQTGVPVLVWLESADGAAWGLEQITPV